MVIFRKLALQHDLAGPYVETWSSGMPKEIADGGADVQGEPDPEYT